MKLTEATRKNGKEVQLFLMDSAAKWCFEPDWAKRVDLARLSIWYVGFKANEFNGLEEKRPGVGFKDLATWARNAEMAAGWDTYLAV